ncbi:MAG: UxaA family hydrolase [Thermodesulfobacteriota bacterium]|nr:UxaA family hydrolase [Thermodesulfobacteriota bacterium]
MEEILGFERQDGTVGIRNYVAVIPSVACANGVAGMIARAVHGVVPLYHGHGCGRAVEIDMHTRTLAGLGKNPNVAAVLVVGLGCETIQAEALAGAIAESKKSVEYLVIQKEGGSRKSALKGIEIVRRMLDEANKMHRKPFSLNRIILGLECGGSDAFSGVTANPSVGLAADWLVDQGGTVILTEATEMIGTSHILERRAATLGVAEKINKVVSDAEKRADDILGPLASMVIAPGNMDGGMSSIREKALGCIVKAGSRTINQVVDYGEVPTEKGVVIMDGPGYDMESLAGLGAAGSQLIIFTTGRGNPAGFPIVPVIKVAGTSKLYEAMQDDIDINAGVVLEGRSLQDVADQTIALAKDVINGRQTKAQLNNQDGMVCLYALNPAF